MNIVESLVIDGVCLLIEGGIFAVRFFLGLLVWVIPLYLLIQLIRVI